MPLTNSYQPVHVLGKMLTSEIIMPVQHIVPVLLSHLTQSKSCKATKQNTISNLHIGSEWRKEIL